MAFPPYINIFGGDPIWPSDISYIEYNLDTIGTSITLQFPQVATTAYVTAGTINVLTSNAANTITMPDVTIVSPGYTMWVRNSGSVNLSIYKNDGTTLIVAIAPGLTYALQIIDNTTVNGLWYLLQLGAGSSSVSAAALAGPGLTVNPLDVTKLAVNVTSRIINTPGYTIVQSDRAILLIWTGGTATINLPAIAGMNGFLCYISNLSVGGILTIQCQVGETINNVNSISVNPGVSFEVTAGATAYYTIGAPQFSLNNFSFPDGTISAPSINFQSDTASGFSHAFIDANNEALNFSLNGALQASFATIAGAPSAHFSGSVFSETGVYVFGTDDTKTRFARTVSGAEHIINHIVYNVAGTDFVNMSLNSSGLLSYQTSGGANALDIHTNDLTVLTTATIANLVVTPGTTTNIQRNSVSYMAWQRVMA